MKIIPQKRWACRGVRWSRGSNPGALVHGCGSDIVIVWGDCRSHYIVSVGFHLLWPSVRLTCFSPPLPGPLRKSCLSAEFSSAGKVGNYFRWLPWFRRDPSLSGALWLHPGPVMVTGIANWLVAERAARNTSSGQADLIEFLRRRGEKKKKIE